VPVVEALCGGDVFAAQQSADDVTHTRPQRSLSTPRVLHRRPHAAWYDDTKCAGLRSCAVSQK
jgi:hypothetical protein